MFNQKQQKNRFISKLLKYLVCAIITLIALILLGGLMINHAQKISNTAIIIKNYHIGFMIWRYFLMTVFIAYYPKLISWILSKDENMTERQIKQFAKRRYAILFCVFYELVIVQNILALLINGLLFV